MRAGELRHYVSIYGRDDIRDPVTGASRPQFALLHSNVPARFTHFSGKERMSAQQARSEVTARVMFRAEIAVPDDGQIEYRGQRFDVEAVVPSADWATYQTVFVKKGVTR